MRGVTTSTASTASTGPATGQEAVDGLVGLLDLETLEVNLFRGISPPHSLPRVFGGQVAAQALVAAGRTVPEDREVHSLHAYFIRPGDPAVPIVYETERVRDGRSFTTRRVLAIQHGVPIFSLSASFQLPQTGLQHTQPAPEGVPAPDTLPGLDALASSAGARWLTQGPRPLDMRFVSPPPWSDEFAGASEEPARVWMRADGRLPDDRLLHVCMLTYVSDLTLLGSVLVRHDRAEGPVQMASLDHAMWFHRPFRADEWLLYTCYSPFAGGGRGLATGRFTQADGTLVATTVQEGLVRVPG
jgi:acyl-CoA thioesterase II